MDAEDFYSYKCEGLRVRMIRRVSTEPDSPDDPTELEMWCARGGSSRPVQTHIGDSGYVMWVTEERYIAIAFDDGDERLLYPQEVEWITPPD